MKIKKIVNVKTAESIPLDTALFCSGAFRLAYRVVEEKVEFVTLAKTWVKSMFGMAEPSNELQVTTGILEGYFNVFKGVSETDVFYDIYSNEEHLRCGTIQVNNEGECMFSSRQNELLHLTPVEAKKLVRNLDIFLAGVKYGEDFSEDYKRKSGLASELTIMLAAASKTPLTSL